MDLPRVHLVLGTRPEAVKLAPLADALRAGGLVEPVLVATGQHPAVVTQALAAFDQRPDIVLTLDRRSGELAELVGQLCPALDRLLAEGSSSAVVVQGDTTSALVGGLVAFWRRIPLVHLEAGLRSGDLTRPFPEEANRRLLGVVADLHLAPTTRAVDALLAGGAAADRVLLIGNTVVDAVFAVAARTGPFDDPRLAAVEEIVAAGAGRCMVVTAHRRESWGAGLDRVLAAVDAIVAAHPDLHCVLPAHSNPAVRAQVDAALRGRPRVIVTDPLPYPALCRLLALSSVVLTDSGGIQEEAPSFGVPVLVLRDVTERLEAVETGWAELVGTDTDRIVARTTQILAGRFETPTEGNPFGDGKAALRGAQAIAALLGRGDAPPEWAAPIT
jgi:UDP-N-acetylglucosamine 2-epimerase (non-hydrolysing)